MTEDNFTGSPDFDPDYAPSFGDSDEPTGHNAAASFEDFYAYLPSGTFIYAPTRDNWPTASVNAVLPKVNNVTPAIYLAKSRPVHQMTWAPGLPMVVRGKRVDNGGWIADPGNVIFNLYQGPTIAAGNANKAQPWIEHVRRVYPGEAEHLFDWFAHRVQNPGIKCNHAIVMGGNQGVGKDTILEPVKAAIGPWNFEDISPSAAMGRFNGFLKSVILRISEARDLGHNDRYGFYDRTKTWIAAPPDVHRIDEKNRREYAAFNVCGVIITTNRKDGIYLEPDDRRHFVAWSNADKEDFPASYWTKLYGFFEKGGNEAVAAWLMARDLSQFDCKAPPPKTDAFFEIVNAARAPESSEMSDALELLQWPGAVTINEVADAAQDEFRCYLRERKNSRLIPHRFADCGYEAHRNPGQVDGRHRIKGQNVAVYVNRRLSSQERFEAVRALNLRTLM